MTAEGNISEDVNFKMHNRAIRFVNDPVQGCQKI